MQGKVIENCQKQFQFKCLLYKMFLQKPNTLLRTEYVSGTYLQT